MQNYQKKPNTIEALLKQAKDYDLSSFDAELLLAETLGVSRVLLYAWPKKEVEVSEVDLFMERVHRRSQKEPVAYILGKKEFWSLSLEVNPSVLIPRPETELLVEKALTLETQNSKINILELGTGSGALSIALAKERPGWSIIATDASIAALGVAKRNAKKWNVNNIDFRYGDWFGALSSEDFVQPNQQPHQSYQPYQSFFNLIVSNPPYIEKQDPHLQTLDLRFEPRMALEGGEDGLRDIKTIIKKGHYFLAPNGWLMLEHGFNQAQAVSALFTEENYINIKTYTDLAGVNRMTLAQKK